MATLKHISSKNSDYSAIEAYLIYQHDAFTGKQLLDEQGKPKLRESYILDTLVRRFLVCNGLPAGKPKVQQEQPPR